MLLVELHQQQVDEDVGEWISKAIVALAMAASVGTAALGFGKGPVPPDFQARIERLILNASLRQLSRIREAIRKRSVEDLKRELDALRSQSKNVVAR